MSIGKATTMPRAFPVPAWVQTATREVTRPVFPRLSPRVRPYLLAVTLFGAASTLMSVGDAALLRFGLPWALVSLLIIVAAANLWGSRPAALVLALSALYGAVVVPAMAITPATAHSPLGQVLLIRTAVFAACGAVTVWLTYRARQMQERAERRREVVTALRTMILPEALASAPGYDLGSVYRPARHEEEVGGDFYDFYSLGDGRYGVLIGDVMGKGKEAATSTALLRYSVRAFTSTGLSPAQSLSQLNHLIDTQEMPFAMASLFLGVLDTRAGSLCYANAGHEPPMLRQASGAEEILGATGPVLGTGLHIAYEERTTTLGPRDTLLLMTDGVTEARNAQGRFLGSDGAWRLLHTALESEATMETPSATRPLAALDRALMDYIGESRRDDIAMLLLQGT